MQAGYAYVWEFQVRPGAELEFEWHYGPAGAWVNLFRQSPGYLESLLLKDNAIPGRYVTVDRWISEDAHREFRASFAESYDRLDKDLGHLTVCERSLGAFSELPGGRSSEQDSSIPAPS